MFLGTSRQDMAVRRRAGRVARKTETVAVVAAVWVARAGGRGRHAPQGHPRRPPARRPALAHLQPSRTSPAFFNACQ
ncbi:hypothetical protein E2C01_011276 [Portunus trituberculatus]|uniref:Uncharacterized protein n=1 Tax=Portunus trituberculatus TaxID=210409 RepID=A0A5B7DAP0_PORTR|nr:hypothetical protein [Portunus trituberculatus]